MFERGRAELFEHKQAQPMARLGRAALAGIQERGQVLGVDLWQVPWQDRSTHAHALEHDPAQRRIGFLPHRDQQELNLVVPTLSLGMAFTARGDGSDTLGEASQNRTGRLTSEAYKAGRFLSQHIGAAICSEIFVEKCVYNNMRVSLLPRYYCIYTAFPKIIRNK
jgi:hypothetical protein